MSRLLWLPDVLNDAGVRVTVMPGWESRGSGLLFDPRVIVDHHTAARPTASNPTPSLRVVTDGRADLRGPLCNVLTAADGRAVVIASGTSNNAGKGGSAPHRASHNRHTIGNEVEHPGSGPVSPALLEAVARIDAAICRHLGWDEYRCVSHKEWATPPGRKVDPVWSQDDHRARVRGLLGIHQFQETIASFTGEQMGSYNERRAAARQLRDDLYEKLRGTPPDPSGRAYWDDMLDFAVAKDVRANDPMDTNANGVLIAVHNGLKPN